jgi:flagellar hook-length control protein FliK
MTQINLDSLASLVPAEPPPSEPVTPTADGSQSFDSHLERAHTEPHGRDADMTTPSESSPPPTDESPVETDKTETHKTSEDEANDETEQSPEIEVDAESEQTSQPIVADAAPVVVEEVPTESNGKPIERNVPRDSVVETSQQDIEDSAAIEAAEKTVEQPAIDNPELPSTAATKEPVEVAKQDDVPKPSNDESLQTTDEQPPQADAPPRDRAKHRKTSADVPAGAAPGDEEPQGTKPAQLSPVATSVVDDGAQMAGRRDAETAEPIAKPLSGGPIEKPSETAPRPAAEATPRTAAAPGSAPADRARFVQRVARAFEAMGAREGSVRLRLSPPELGSLRLEIALRDGAMSARLEADNASTRNLLLDNLPALRDRLAEMDIKIQQFDVELNNRSSDGQSQRAADQPQSRDHDGRQDRSQAPKQGDADAEGTDQATPVNRPGEGTQLNVVI